MSRVVVLMENGVPHVLTESVDTQVLVIDRDVEGGPATLVVSGALAAVDTLLDGTPALAPELVKAIFEEVAPQLARLSTSDALTVKDRTQLKHLAKLHGCPEVIAAPT